MRLGMASLSWLQHPLGMWPTWQRDLTCWWSGDATWIPFIDRAGSHWGDLANSPQPWKRKRHLSQKLTWTEMQHSIAVCPDQWFAQEVFQQFAMLTSCPSVSPHSPAAYLQHVGWSATGFSLSDQVHTACVTHCVFTRPLSDATLQASRTHAWRHADWAVQRRQAWCILAEGSSWTPHLGVSCNTPCCRVSTLLESGLQGNSLPWRQVSRVTDLHGDGWCQLHRITGSTLQGSVVPHDLPILQKLHFQLNQENCATKAALCETKRSEFCEPRQGFGVLPWKDYSCILEIRFSFALDQEGSQTFCSVFREKEREAKNSWEEDVRERRQKEESGWRDRKIKRTNERGRPETDKGWKRETEKRERETVSERGERTEGRREWNRERRLRERQALKPAKLDPQVLKHARLDPLAFQTCRTRPVGTETCITQPGSTYSTAQTMNPVHLNTPQTGDLSPPDSNTFASEMDSVGQQSTG